MKVNDTPASHRVESIYPSSYLHYEKLPPSSSSPSFPLFPLSLSTSLPLPPSDPGPGFEGEVYCCFCFVSASFAMWHPILVFYSGWLASYLGWQVSGWQTN